MAQNSILKTKKRKELDLILEGEGGNCPSCPCVAPPLSRTEKNLRSSQGWIVFNVLTQKEKSIYHNICQIKKKRMENIIIYARNRKGDEK
jgi:hypothetical protein